MKTKKKNQKQTNKFQWVIIKLFIMTFTLCLYSSHLLFPTKYYNRAHWYKTVISCFAQFYIAQYKPFDIDDDDISILVNRVGAYMATSTIRPTPIPHSS